jgi:hypothetical protein
MQYMQLQMASDVVPRCFMSIIPMREIRIVEEVLLRQHSSGTSQQGSYARHRGGYMSLISVLITWRSALVGTLWTKNLDQCPLICGSFGWRALMSVESIGR